MFLSFYVTGAVPRAASMLSAEAQPRKLSSYDAEAPKLLGRMTLDEKIGQMTQADQQFLKSLDDIETWIPSERWGFRSR